MKIKNYLILLGLILFYSVQFSYGQCGVVASDNKTIVCGGDVQLDALSAWTKTTDSTFDAVGFRSVYFVNVDTGYTVVGNGEVHRTRDGGKTWTTHTLGANLFRAVFFTDADTGFVVGKNVKNEAVIAKTIDGGDNWSTQTITNCPSLRSVYFINKSIGFAAGDAVAILKTTDGGKTWVRKQVFATDHYVSINFPTPTIGYAIGEIGNVTKTIDGGETWVNNANPVGLAFSACFTDANTGFFGSDKGVLLKTTDGGTSWIPHTVGDVNDTIKAVFFVNSNIGYVGSNKSIWKTIDGGNTWKKQSVNANINSIYFPTGKVGYATGTRTLKLIEPESITWSPAAGLSSVSVPYPFASPTKTTTYKVTFVTLNGCSASDSVTVFVNPLTADAGFDHRLPCGDTTQLNTVISNYTGNGTLTYSWFPATGLNNSTISNPITDANKETVYTVTLTTPNGCSAKDSITVYVDLFIAQSGGDVSLICGGGAKFNGVSSNYKDHSALLYSWFPSSGLDATTIERPSATVTQNTKYYVIVSTPNGCHSTDSLQVLVAPLTANAGNDKLHVCGDSVQLESVLSNYTGTAPLGYSWSPTVGLNNPTLANPTSKGAGITYTVTVITSNGCQASDQVKVNLKKMEAIDICMVGVDSSGKNIVFWEHPNATTIDSVIIYKETSVTNNFVKIAGAAYNEGKFIDKASQPNVKSDKYRISILDTCEFESPQSAAHKTMHLSINKGIGTSWNLIWKGYEGFSVPTYTIYRGTDPLNLQQHDAVSGTTTQYTDYNPPPGVLYYQIQVVNPHPCSAANGISARSNITSSNGVGIKKFSNELNFSIYPNPANNLLMVNLENVIIDKNMTLTIYNTLGAIVKTIHIEQDKQQINISDLDNGFYSIEIRSANYNGQQKLIIQR